MSEPMVPLSRVLELLRQEADARTRFEGSRLDGYASAVPIDEVIERLGAVGRERFPNQWPGA